MQIVTTTHSPLTAQQAGEDELYFLRRPSPSAAAELIPYEGAPNLLKLDDVLTGPAFGLSTLDSREVEQIKTEYRTLREGDREVPAAMADALRELTPDPATAHDSRLEKLLENVSQELEAQ